MKITKEAEAFRPITLVIETLIEYNVMLSALNSLANKEADSESRKSLAAAWWRALQEVK